MEDFLIRGLPVYLNNNWRENGLNWWYVCSASRGVFGYYLTKSGRWHSGYATPGQHNVGIFTTREECLAFAQKFAGTEAPMISGQPWSLQEFHGEKFIVRLSGQYRWLSKKWEWVQDSPDSQLLVVSNEDELEQLWAEHNNPELQAQRAAERKARLIACGWED